MAPCARHRHPSPPLTHTTAAPASRGSELPLPLRACRGFELDQLAEASWIRRQAPRLDRPAAAIAGFAQSLVERRHTRVIGAGRRDAEVADYRHRLLLRAEDAWGCHRAAQEQDQLA